MRAFTATGWFRTGDLGTMDERGYFRITDRKKDMIVVSGFKVFPNEVEEVVMSHPGVLEAACIGVPDARTGHAVMVVAVRSDPKLDAAELVAYCREHLTAYKVPRRFVVVCTREKLSMPRLSRENRRNGTTYFFFFFAAPAFAFGFGETGCKWCRHPQKSFCTSSITNSA